MSALAERRVPTIDDAANEKCVDLNPFGSGRC